MSGGSVRSGESRHSAREVALQVLYAVDLGETGPRDAAASRAARVPPGETAAAPDAPEAPAATADGDPAETPEEARARAFDRVTEHFPVPRSAVAFARELVEGVVGRSAALDEWIGRHARNWRVERMAAVDRNVLRLGVYELLETATPVAVVIDEAVDLARRFGSESSPAFVNGVLDAVAKEVRGG